MEETYEKDIVSEKQSDNVKKHNTLIGYYNYTVVLTYVGMFIGFAGILFAINDQIAQALLCLMLSGFCDMFDGAIASTRVRTKQEKRFGIQIDSLSDLICFGVLPAIIVNAQIESKFNVWICGFYVLCALIRLAYYNVDEEERQEGSTDKRKCYTGLPVTSIAVLLPLFYPEISENFLYLCVLLAVSFAFVLPFEIKKPQNTMKIVLLLLGAFAFFKVLMAI